MSSMEHMGSFCFAEADSRFIYAALSTKSLFIFLQSNKRQHTEQRVETETDEKR